MKIYIIFMALLMTNLSFLVYQSDMTDLLLLENEMKTAAEEAACGAGQYYDEASFSEGYYVFKRAEGLKWTEHFLSRYTGEAAGEAPLRVSVIESLESEVYFFDDSGKCNVYKNGEFHECFEFEYPYITVDDEGYEFVVTSPSVVVKLNAVFHDIFRLPFLKYDNIVRSAMYEQKDYK